jgi:phospholipid transport system substrate-binding protein
MKSFTVTDISRRAALAGASALALTLAAGPALALTEAQARDLIGRATAEITSVINSGRSEAAMYREFERIFTRYADIDTIARSALGPPARSASSAQLRAFSEAFTAYMSRKYGARFREFIGGEIVVQGARPVKSFMEVQAVANLRGDAPFPVTFLVSDRSGSARFFDLLIEGISLLKTERTEIGSMLDRRRGDIDALIRDLRG